MPGSRKKGEERGRYYRTIARCFFEHRGAPFFLSSKDLDVVARWEKMEIPLPVVLEGIRSSFARARKTLGRKRRLHYLSFCHATVLEAYELHKERKVGRRQVLADRDKRKVRMRDELRTFLASFPGEIGYVKDIYLRALKEAARRDPDEEKLEQMEEEVEELLLKSAASGEKERIKKETQKEYRTQDDEELARVFRIKLIKHMRDQHKLPHISLYYY